jgi:formate hydrogenlyase subunit 4
MGFPSSAHFIDSAALTTPLPLWVWQTCQVMLLLAAAPLVSGVISRFEARIQSRRGPSIWQPYFDIIKYFGKESLRPQGSSWLFRAAPVIAFACYCTVALLIPILSHFPLPLGFMGDILGGAFILALAGFVTALAALEGGSPYTGLGGSRAIAIGSLVEPTLIAVFFAIALLSHSDNPYLMGATIQASVGAWFRPGHLLAAAAFFFMLLVDTGRIPIESSGTLELGMIDEARLLEHAGPEFAFYKWGGALKQFLLFTVFLNVLVAPWGLATTPTPSALFIAVVTLLGKMLLLGSVIGLIEISFAKLRLFRIPEFMAAGFVIAVLAVLILTFGQG